VFKVLESNANRFTVQISNEREDHVFATLIAIPDYYGTARARREDPLSPTEDKTLITFYEAPSGQPLPIKEWFYPGQSYGREFVYSKHEAALIAAAGKETVPSEATAATVASIQTPAAQPAPEQPAPEQTAPAPVAQEEPIPAVTEPQPAPVTHNDDVTTDSAVTAEPGPQPSPEQTTDQTTDQTTTLPSTGSEWPLAGLIGLLSLAGAFALRVVQRLS
jgi:LPXTG-motif cell wall-anchored protein